MSLTDVLTDLPRLHHLGYGSRSQVDNAMGYARRQRRAVWCVAFVRQQLRDCRGWWQRLQRQELRIHRVGVQSEIDERRLRRVARRGCSADPFGASTAFLRRGIELRALHLRLNVKAALITNERQKRSIDGSHLNSVWYNDMDGE